MYAVIFTATTKELDMEYAEMAAHLRELAIAKYGCTEFTSCTEGNREIAISYWPSLEHIAAWRDDNEHKQAQAIGKSRWYDSYQVHITKVLE
jgi:heme-degrading monooxygenase HmoA